MNPAAPVRKQRAPGEPVSCMNLLAYQTDSKEPYAKVLGRIVGRRATAYNGSLK